jgi:hypothetical protein
MRLAKREHQCIRENKKVLGHDHGHAKKGAGDISGASKPMQAIDLRGRARRAPDSPPRMPRAIMFS